MAIISLESALWFAPNELFLQFLYKKRYYIYAFQIKGVRSIMFGPVNASGNSVATSPQTTQSSAGTMKERLDAWVKSAPNGTGECREIAAQRINSAYEHHTADLDLSNLELTSLPEHRYLHK